MRPILNNVAENALDEPFCPDLLSIYKPLRHCRAGNDPPPDPQLEREVLRFSRLPPDMAAHFGKRPLVLFRNVPTPNMEMIRFCRLAKLLKRPALIISMQNDLFTPSVNPSKLRLAKMPITSKNTSYRYVTVISFDVFDKCQFDQITCLDGMPFIEFHKLILGHVIGSHVPPILDLSEFYSGERPRDYYLRVFALFTCFGVLAENFAGIGHERRFTEDVVLPAFTQTEARFGIAPRIVPLLPIGEEIDAKWEFYPNSVMERALIAAGRLPSRERQAV